MMKTAVTLVWMRRRTKRTVIREITLLLLCSIPWTEVKKSLMIFNLFIQFQTCLI